MQQSVKDAILQSDPVIDVCCNYNVITELMARIRNAGVGGGTLTYSSLVSGVNFGIHSHPHIIDTKHWSPMEQKLIGSYLMCIIRDFVMESDCIVTSIVISQDNVQKMQGSGLPSKHVRKWLYEMGAFSPNNNNNWETFIWGQMNKTHQFFKNE